MSDDEKMFQIGVCSVWAVLFLSVILQVAFRTQNRQINQIRRDIVKTQQWSDDQILKFKEILIENECIGHEDVINLQIMIKSYVESDVKILNQGLITFKNDI